jgi:predicted NACHT family NTPase
MMIVGPSGSGRSSMLRYLGYTASMSARNPGARGHETLFPILIRANQLASRPGSIEDQVLSAMRTSAPPVSRTLLPSTFLSDLVETPGLLLLLMIDGLDEIQNSRDMADIVDFVGRIQGETTFGRRTRIVVTCRPATAEHFRYSEFDIYEIQPMTESAIRIAALQWLDRESEAFLEANAALIETGMLCSPLTLSIALTLHERGGGKIPDRLVDLYEALVEVLAERWKQPRLREDYGPEVVDHAADILGFLALELLRAASVQDQEWVVGTVTRYFIQHLKVAPAAAARHAAQFLRFAETESLFLRVSGDRLFWSHQSFQDYFAARRLTTSEHEAGNAVKAIRARWFDVSRGHAPAFATALLPEAEVREAIVGEILSSGRPERFDFVTKLLVDGSDLPDELVSAFIEDLVTTAVGERDTYGTELRPSPRASFAIDLLASLGHLEPAAAALSRIAFESGWPARMKERARSA